MLAVVSLGGVTLQYLLWGNRQWRGLKSSLSREAVTTDAS